MSQALRHLLPLSLLVLSACAGSDPNAASKRLDLDPEASKITATAVKNESKDVPVTFGKLSGWADAGTGKAWVQIPIETLVTGDVARDHNIKTLFFEVAKGAGFAMAEFTLDAVEGDLSALAQGKLLAANGRGRLKLHGGELALEGPLVFSKEGATTRVSLKEGWVVKIDKMGMAAALAALNQNCPQPHRVANAVALSGDLVFKP